MELSVELPGISCSRAKSQEPSPWPLVTVEVLTVKTSVRAAYQTGENGEHVVGS